MYIGMSYRPSYRFREHVSAAMSGGSLPIHKAIRKYGAESILMKVMATGTQAYISSLEIAAIAAFDTRRTGYNVSPGGGISPMAIPETRAKVSEKLRGGKLSIEHRAALSAAHTGRKHTPETIAKMSVAQSGRVISLEAREKLRASRVGKLASDEARKNMSLSRIGRKHSQETISKIRATGMATRALKRATEAGL